MSKQSKSNSGNFFQIIHKWISEREMVTGTVEVDFWKLSEQQLSEVNSLDVYLRGYSMSGAQDINIPEVLGRYIIYFRLVNQGIPLRVARKTVFGPDLEDERVAEHDRNDPHTGSEDCVDYSGMEGVAFFAVMPRALELLDFSQRGIRSYKDFRIPESWLNWTWKRQDPGIPRISLHTFAEVGVWVDSVVAFGGIPRVIAVVSPEDEVQLPEKSPILGIDILSCSTLYKIEQISKREGRINFFGSADLYKTESPSVRLREILEFLSFSRYRVPYQEDLPLYLP